METIPDKIKGGAFQVARKLFESDLWNEKPLSWKIIWIYILGNVNHKKKGKFQRGEGYFNFSKDARQIGKEITSDMIKSFCQYARATSMIDTTRTTRGMIIKVMNYDRYQRLHNYKYDERNTTPTTSQPRENHERNTMINKNDNNDKNEKNRLSSNLNFYSFNSNKIKYVPVDFNSPRNQPPRYERKHRIVWGTDDHKYAIPTKGQYIPYEEFKINFVKK